MKIHVKLVDGDSKSVDVKVDDTVTSLKRSIQDATSIPVLQQILIFENQALANGLATLSDVGMKTDAKEVNVILARRLEPVAKNLDDIMKLLKMDHIIIKEEALEALGELSRISVKDRDMVISRDVLSIIKTLCNKDATIETMQKCSRAIASLCSGKPLPAVKDIGEMFDILSTLLCFSDIDVLFSTCKSVLELSDGPDDLVNKIIGTDEVSPADSMADKGICARLVELLEIGNEGISDLILKTLFNLTISSTMMEDEKNQAGNFSVLIDKAKIIPSLVRILTASVHTNQVKSLCCRTVSLFAQRGSCIKPVIQPILSLLEGEGGGELIREALWVIANIVSEGEEKMKVEVVKLGGVGVLAKLTNKSLENTEIVLLALEAIAKLAKHAEKPKGVVDELNQLLTKSSDGVVKEKAQIILAFFSPTPKKKKKGKKKKKRKSTGGRASMTAEAAAGATTAAVSTGDDAADGGAGGTATGGNPLATEAETDVKKGEAEPTAKQRGEAATTTTTAATANDDEDDDDEDDDENEEVDEGGESIRVVVRVRPFIKNEAKECKDVIFADEEGKRVLVKDPMQAGFDPNDRETWRRFAFDAVYGKGSPQPEVYKKSVSRMARSLLKGFNSTIFAYGQTSSGKTHTMMGVLGVPALEGITPRLIRSLFGAIERGRERGNSFIITISYLEIYNERVYDLLAQRRRPRSPANRESLQIRQGKGGFYVPKLTKHVVTDDMQMLAFIEMGSSARSVAATTQNSESSRSHSMLIIYLEKGSQQEGDKLKGTEGTRNIVGAKLNLVDLAGSERFQGLSKTMQKESTSINQSLTALANVIAALTSTKKGTFVPYRNSALTKLLRDSLGGNALTLMFANINPCDRNVNETVSTLRYASRAKKIKNKPKVNQNPKDALLSKLQDEIAKLRKMLEKKDEVIQKIHVAGPGPTAAAPSRETAEEEMKRKEFVEKVRQDLLTRLNDTQGSMIKGGVTVKASASSSSSFKQGARRRMTVVGAGTLMKMPDDDVFVGGYGDSQHARHSEEGGGGSATARRSRSRGHRKARSGTSSAAHERERDPIEEGVFKAMREMRRTQAKYQSQTVELQDVLKVTQQEKEMLEETVQELENRLAEAEEQNGELEAMLECARETEEKYAHELDVSQQAAEAIRSKLEVANETNRRLASRTPREAARAIHSIVDREEVSRGVGIMMEAQAYAMYVNVLLGTTPLMLKTGTVPITPGNPEEFVRRVQEGILPAALVNMAIPNTIDERALNVKAKEAQGAPLSRRAMLENLTLVLQSCRAVGVELGSIDVEDLLLPEPQDAEGSGKEGQEEEKKQAGGAEEEASVRVPHLSVDEGGPPVLSNKEMAAAIDFAYCLLKFLMMRQSMLLSHPEIRRAGIADGGGDGEPYTSSDMVMAWCNHFLKESEDVHLTTMEDQNLNLPIEAVDEGGGNKIPAFLTIALSQRIAGSAVAKRLASKLFKAARTGESAMGLESMVIKDAEGKTIGCQGPPPARFVHASGLLPQVALAFLQQAEDEMRKPTPEVLSSRRRLGLLFPACILRHSEALRFCAERDRLSSQPHVSLSLGTSALEDELIIEQADSKLSNERLIEKYEGKAGAKDHKEPREEKVFRMWINNLGVPVDAPKGKETKKDSPGASKAKASPKSVYIHRLLPAVSDGVLLLKVLDRLQISAENKPLVNWKKAYPKPANKFRELANCDQLIELVKKPPFGFKIGTTSGRDINEKDPKHVLSLTWQLMQFHMFEFLKKIYVKKFGSIQRGGGGKTKGIDESKILHWSISTIDTALDERGGYPAEASHLNLEQLGVHIKGFDDKTLRTSLFLLLLLWAKDVRHVNWDNVSPGETAEERFANARYALSISRKLGCMIFLQPGDIVRVKPQLILTFVGAVLAN